MRRPGENTRGIVSLRAALVEMGADCMHGNADLSRQPRHVM